MIQKIAKLENWKRDDKNIFDSHKGYWGPFLTPEESEELEEPTDPLNTILCIGCSDQCNINIMVAVDDPEINLLCTNCYNNYKEINIGI